MEVKETSSKNSYLGYSIMLTPLHCLMLSLRLSKADFTATLHYSLIVCSHSTSGENGGLRCCRSCPERIAGSGVERARKGPQNTLGGRAGDRTLCVFFWMNLDTVPVLGSYLDTDLPVPVSPCLLILGSGTSPQIPEASALNMAWGKKQK